MNEVSESTDAYFENMYSNVSERQPVWKELARFMQRDFPVKSETVLDLGAGYCTFINNISAKRRIASDLSCASKKHAQPGVEFIEGSCDQLRGLENESVDVVFASNLLEHLDWKLVESTLQEIMRVLRPGGRFLILQPNFTYAFREYFHDYTHRTIFTHIGLSDLLESVGLKPLKVIPRLIPFSMQSKYGGISVSFLPIWLMRLLIRVYLLLPLKPFAKQMYLVAEK